uniref:DUSP domain-containing protein n=1 Tax=Globisporangium ultimum (strain ATCC 200006 / CBS 805.95 / DAOM BR144) TaxID=431595 RepID=K3X0T6_GLOUD
MSKAYAATERDRFGAVPLSPRQNDPLIVPGSASLDAMASGCMAISLRVVAATSLRAMKKGLTSNPYCEISLVHHDGSSQHREHNAWHMGQDLSIDQKISGSQSSQPGLSREMAQMTTRSKPFRTKIVKSSLNPIWDFDVDFGDVDTETVVGVVFTVKHGEKFGMVKKDIGELFLSLREIMDLKMQPPHEQSFHLQPTEEILLREAQEGPSSRKYGKLVVRVNTYGVTRADAPASGSANYTTITELRPSDMSETSFAHEDDFSKSDKKMQLHDIKAEVRKLKTLHQTRPNPGEMWYAISAKWIQDWLLFASKYKGDEKYSPGSIDNMCLVSDNLLNGTFQIRTDLSIKKDFRMINRASWDFYQEKYEGGPAIEVRIPPDCENTSVWIYDIKLHEVGRVGTNYVGSDSD